MEKHEDPGIEQDPREVHKKEQEMVKGDATIISAGDQTMVITGYKPGLVFERIPKIMTDAPAVGKTEKNKQQGFNFRGIEGVYDALTRVMGKHQVFTTHRVLELSRHSVKSKSGSQGVFLIAKFRFRFWGPDTSWVETEIPSEASDYGDKASNKLISIAHKYALVSTFCLPYNLDDPDEGNIEEKVGHDADKTPVGNQHLKHLYPIMTKNKWVASDVSNIINAYWGLSATTDLTIAQLAELEKIIKSKSPKAAAADAMDFVKKRDGVG